MIVRISTEDQYELLPADAEALEELDRQAIAAVEAGDEEQFRAAFGRLIEFVRSKGQLVSDDRLESSDLILPPPDATMAEASAEFSADGLLPE